MSQFLVSRFGVDYRADAVVIEEERFRFVELESSLADPFLDGHRSPIVVLFRFVVEAEDIVVNSFGSEYSMGKLYDLLLLILGQIFPFDPHLRSSSSDCSERPDRNRNR